MTPQNPLKHDKNGGTIDTQNPLKNGETTDTQKAPGLLRCISGAGNSRYATKQPWNITNRLQSSQLARRLL